MRQACTTLSITTQGRGLVDIMPPGSGVDGRLGHPGWVVDRVHLSLIGWISSVDRDGRRNLAPYSFFNGFNYHPPIIGFSSVGWKDSVRNIEQTGEFAWNLATRDLATAMNQSSASVPPEVDEFEISGLTPVASRRIKPPRVAESPVTMECRLSEIVQLHTADRKPVDSWLVLGEVVAVHIAKSPLKDGIYQTAEAYPILRAGGPGGYAQIPPDSMFDMRRPR